MGKRSGKFIPCENCGNLIYRTATHLKRNIHHFCSKECEMKYKHVAAYEIRHCECCGKKYEVRKKYSKRFCSIECQHEWQKTRIGKLNPKYDRIVFTCDWCKNDYMDKKYKIKNQYHFCSSKCRKEWYRNVFSQNEDWVETSRIRAAKMLSDGRFRHTLTEPQKIVNQILDELNILYENEYNCKYYAVDNYLSDYNLIIEVMGDFWHLNPIKHNFIRYANRLKTIKNDRKKHNYISKYLNINILYLWENDIIQNPELCKMIIAEYIKNNGQLKNYQSFNYNNLNDKITLNAKLVFPYFLMNDEELEKYIQLTA